MHLGHYGIEVKFEQEGPFLLFDGSDLTINEQELNRIAVEEGMTSHALMELILESACEVREYRADRIWLLSYMNSLAHAKERKMRLTPEEQVETIFQEDKRYAKGAYYFFDGCNTVAAFKAWS